MSCIAESIDSTLHHHSNRWKWQPCCILSKNVEMKRIHCHLKHGYSEHLCPLKKLFIDFYPRPVLAFGYCRCLRLSVCPSVRVCGNHLLVRAITHHPFKLGSPNLDQRCKRPWLRSLLFFGGDWPWPSRSTLTSKSKVTPFWASRHDNSSPVQARITKFGPKVQNTWVKIPINFEIDWS